MLHPKDLTIDLQSSTKTNLDLNEVDGVSANYEIKCTLPSVGSPEDIRHCGPQWCSLVRGIVERHRSGTRKVAKAAQPHLLGEKYGMKTRDSPDDERRQRHYNHRQVNENLFSEPSSSSIQLDNVEASEADCQDSLWRRLSGHQCNGQKKKKFKGLYCADGKIRCDICRKTWLN
ncbi:Hypothetical protein CINCED_3A008512 [Cinara cedri]|uniref:Uncharacterized protein n=1 Tax=Cinara cedri TaxID=506608 RepID=A0A5E4LY31_9HEMI|nr:Hypothetical protein CINCED_3A008512 [Cinara cedri]